MLHLVMLLASALPLLTLLCFKPHKSQPKTCVQQSSGGGNKPPSGRTFASGALPPQSDPPPVHSSGPRQQNSTMTAPQRPTQPDAAITVAASKSRDKKKEPPSSGGGGGSHVAKRRAGASSAKLAKSQSKTKDKKLLQLLKTPKRRNRGDSLEAFTCEDVRSRERTEEMTQVPNSESSRADLKLDVTAQTKELDFSMVTAEDEAFFEEEKHHVLGNVDEVVQDQAYGEDWLEYIGDRLQSEGSMTCDQPTERETSAIICGRYRVWLSEKINSQLEAEGAAPGPAPE